MGLLDFLFAPIEPAYVTRRKQRSKVKPTQSGVLDPLLGLLGLQPVQQPRYAQRRRLALVPGRKPRSPKPPKDTSS